jgi:hypothetical protein
MTSARRDGEWRRFGAILHDNVDKPLPGRRSARPDAARVERVVTLKHA